jgi:hypothetical protein
LRCFFLRPDVKRNGLLLEDLTLQSKPRA